jgi:catechol 2,3-dioxygenase-like lactoylglutathione lyase family enzyme
MSYRPKYLGHVDVFVRDAERSKKWYEEVLDLHTLRIPARLGGLHVGRQGVVA